LGGDVVAVEEAAIEYFEAEWVEEAFPDGVLVGMGAVDWGVGLIGGELEGVRGEVGVEVLIGVTGDDALEMDSEEAGGNLRFCGGWTRAWDGEGRHVKLERPPWTQWAVGFMASANPEGMPTNKLPAATIQFKYDGLARS
jgi:hypothetical protein